MDGIRYLQAGEQGLVVEFGTIIDPQINMEVHTLARTLVDQAQAGVLEIIPTYRSLLVYFDPLKTSRLQVIHWIESLLAGADTGAASAQPTARLVHIPVCYGGEFGPDLPFVAQHNGISTDEVIRIHSSTPYQVYMLGFTPGFPYLGGMSEKIATPRLEKPRLKIPAGSVGIAGNQTGFYPIESPGGWQLIGRTPLKAFDAESAKPFAFDAGDYLQFQVVSADEFFDIRRKADAGTYTPEVTNLQRG